jgi:hypothetical protein
MPHHLAQVNIATMRSAPDAPAMMGLIARIDEMNRLAEQSPGFVWRLPGSQVGHDALRVFADYVVPFEPQRLFYNMSVWKSVEDLRGYVFKTAHADTLRLRQEWIEHFDRARLALWWVPVGHIPTIAESALRLRSVQERGATPYAFTFGAHYREPGRHEDRTHLRSPRQRVPPR